jgi:hypothetical protein
MKVEREGAWARARKDRESNGRWRWSKYIIYMHENITLKHIILYKYTLIKCFKNFRLLLEMGGVENKEMVGEGEFKYDRFDTF